MSFDPPPDPREPPVCYPAGYVPPTEEDWERLEAVAGLTNLMAKYGAARVASWVRSLAAINGEEV